MTAAPFGSERGDPSEIGLMADEAERRDDDLGVTERIQVEHAVTGWGQLLAGCVEAVVEIVTSDGVQHRGRVVDVGSGWCLLDVADRGVLVSSGQVLTVSGLRGPNSVAVRRLGIGAVLRRWSKLRCVVAVHLVDGSTRNGRVGEVLADAFSLFTESGRDGSLMIPNTSLRWVMGDLLSDEH